MFYREASGPNLYFHFGIVYGVVGLKQFLDFLDVISDWSVSLSNEFLLMVISSSCSQYSPMRVVIAFRFVVSSVVAFDFYVAVFHILGLKRFLSHLHIFIIRHDGNRRARIDDEFLLLHIYLHFDTVMIAVAR